MQRPLRVKVTKVREETVEPLAAGEAQLINEQAQAQPTFQIADDLVELQRKSIVKLRNLGPFDPSKFQIALYLPSFSKTYVAETEQRLRSGGVSILGCEPWMASPSSLGAKTTFLVICDNYFATDDEKIRLQETRLNPGASVIDDKAIEVPFSDLFKRKGRGRMGSRLNKRTLKEVQKQAEESQRLMRQVREAQFKHTFLNTGLSMVGKGEIFLLGIKYVDRFILRRLESPTFAWHQNQFPQLGKFKSFAPRLFGVAKVNKSSTPSVVKNNELPVSYHMFGILTPEEALTIKAQVESKQASMENSLNLLCQKQVSQVNHNFLSRSMPMCYSLFPNFKEFQVVLQLPAKTFKVAEEKTGTAVIHESDCRPTKNKPGEKIATQYCKVCSKNFGEDFLKHIQSDFHLSQVARDAEIYAQIDDLILTMTESQASSVENQEISVLASLSTTAGPENVPCEQQSPKKVSEQTTTQPGTPLDLPARPRPKPKKVYPAPVRRSARILESQAKRKNTPSDLKWISFKRPKADKNDLKKVRVLLDQKLGFLD